MNMEITISTEQDGVTIETLNEILKLANTNESELLNKSKRTWVLFAVTRYSPGGENYSSNRHIEGIEANDIHGYLKSGDAPFSDRNSENERDEIENILGNLAEQNLIKCKNDRWMVKND